MITFQWQDHPFGYPTDPDDYDFKSPRTPPFVSCAIQYKSGDVLLRNAVEFPNRTLKALSADKSVPISAGDLKTLSAEEEDQMIAMLENWLETKLKEQP